MSRKLSVKHSAVAYLLNRELNYSQSEIATLMKVSQSTVSNMIKEFEYQNQIQNLQRELDEARQIIAANNLLPDNSNFFDV